MQPQKRKVLVMVAVSLGIISSSFIIPIVVIPAILGITKASDCAVATGCAQDTFSRCEAYRSSTEEHSFGEAMDRGWKGMLCMTGLDGGEARAVLGTFSYSSAATLNKIQVHMH
jgi:hypothetical protein